MKIVVIALAAGTLGLAACSTTVAETSGAPPVTKTVTPAASRAPVTQAPVTQAPAPQPPSAAAAQPVPSVTDPWAVVSAYYGDVESGDYAQAWALLSSGMATGCRSHEIVPCR